MRKKIQPKIFFITLIIALIIAILVAIIQNNNDKDRTIKMYKEMCSKDKYTFSMEELNSEINYCLTISKKSNEISIDTVSNNEHTTTLVRDELLYYIMHNEQEYYLYDSSQIESDILIDDLNGIEEMEYTEGHEKINGKDYHYEEYEGITAFIIWLDYEHEESNIKTRFYFNGNKIVYIKNIVDDQEELLKVGLKDEVNDELFEIPEEYAELDI